MLLADSGCATFRLPVNAIVTNGTSTPKLFISSEMCNSSVVLANYLAVDVQQSSCPWMCFHYLLHRPTASSGCVTSDTIMANYLTVMCNFP